MQSPSTSSQPCITLQNVRELNAYLDDLQPDTDCQPIYDFLFKARQLDDVDLQLFADVTLPKLDQLCADGDGHVRKQVVILYLLGNPDTALLSCLEQHEAAQPFDLRSGFSLFMHAHYHQRNWLVDIVDGIDEHACAMLQHFDAATQNDIHILRLIRMTNKSVIDVSAVRKLVGELDTSSIDNELIVLYVDEIKFILRVIDLCNNGEEAASQLFQRIVDKVPLLDVLSENLRLDDAARWKDVAELLAEDEHRFVQNSESDDVPSELEQFHCYTIHANMITALKESRRADKDYDITQQVNDAKETLNKLSPKLQLHMLEDIYMLCFLKWEHFEPDANANSTLETTVNDNVDSAEEASIDTSYVCTDKELRVLLHFLRPCIDELRTKLPLRSVHADRLQKLDAQLKDALWRLDLFDDGSSFGMSHMLSDAETLIHKSVLRGRFDKAHQVIQIYNLQATQLAEDVAELERFANLHTDLKTAFKYRALHQKLSDNKPLPPEKDPNRILKAFLDVKSSHSSTVNVNDVAFLTAMSSERTVDVLDCLDFAPEFRDWVSNLLAGYEESSLRVVLTDPRYSGLDVDSYRIDRQHAEEVDRAIKNFYRLNDPMVAASSEGHLVYKAFAELQRLAGESKADMPNYFQRFFSYLKVFLRVFSEGGNHLDLISRNGFVSYFAILEHSREEWMTKLIYDRKVDPQAFEHLFNCLKLDLLYHTTNACFPEVPLVRHAEEDVKDDKEEEDEDKEEVEMDKTQSKPLREPTQDVMDFVVKRNWLLAYLINAVFGKEQSEDNSTRTKYFDQYVKTEEIQNLKILYDNNAVVAALSNDHYARAMEYIRKYISENESSENESAVEANEDNIRSDWLQMLMLINSLPEVQLGEEAWELKDCILSKLVTDSFEDDGYKYVKQVRNDLLRRQLIWDNFREWPGEFCASIFKREGDADMLEWPEKILFCEEIKHLFDLSLWSKVYQLCAESPGLVYTKLLSIPRAVLLLNFEKQFNTGELLLHTPTQYISTLFQSNEELALIEQLLDKLEDPIPRCLQLIETIRNLNQLEFLTEYLERKHSDDEMMRNIRVGTMILREFAAHDREHLWCLISNPLAIIEMLLMNIKLEQLAGVLARIRGGLENCEFSDNVISLEAIDELLRRYAEKSLEFRVILCPHPSVLKDSETKLLESLDSIYGPDRKRFQMPEEVPSKAEWTPNDRVLECMCCLNTVFSMFNRRHHCRRCGRVICFNCSTMRMRVPTYGNLLVRVCVDCYDQSKADATSDSTSTKSVMYDHWFLSDTDEHNAIVRQEFSYEHAPSVSLCLSIMKYHTHCEAYPRFLLDQCDAMLKLLQPPARNAPQEVDYALVIKMLKSLAIAAKMIAADCQLPWGASQADRILSQADLFALLASRACLHLLPSSSSSGAPYVDGNVLRKLRDTLLMQEEWLFALDVSTKAGLDNAGVFAAWGKSCLKAGCLQLAREKFQRCLGDALDDEEGSSSGRHRTYSRTSVGPDSKPLRDPPIVEQIIEILESNTLSFTIPTSPTHKTHQLLGQKTGTTLDYKSSAVLIQNRLKRLKSLSNGSLELNYEFKGCNLEPVYFQECLYYLRKYGSHLGLLSFYLKHNCVNECLMYMHENKVHADIFIEVYVICLRDGKIDLLQKHMSRIDSTLDVWKDYLKAICRHLEKQELFNSLYQLQQYMVDYVRAAMTCIRFYNDDARTYAELAANVHHLEKAEAHLRQELEQQQWIEVNAVGNAKSGYEEKPALSNPALVMKMSAKSIDQHIRTIRRQIEVTRFLGAREQGDMQLLQRLVANWSGTTTPIEEVDATAGSKRRRLPTLFGAHDEKTHVAVLLIVCGERIEDGYTLGNGIIQDYKLKAVKVYCLAGRQLAHEDRYQEIAELVACVKGGSAPDVAVVSICDEMLTAAVRTLNRAASVPTSQLEVLIKLIADRAAKISIYIETKQLKSAYLLAAKHNRYGDIRRILREAELINKQDIMRLCNKLLQAQHSHAKD